MPRTLRVAVAARPVPGNRTAIAAVLRWEGADATRTVVRRLTHCGVAQGAYRALLLGLWEARRVGARQVALTIEDPQVVAQLTGGEALPTEAIGLYLQVRALRNAFAETRIVAGDASAEGDLAAAQFAAAASAGTTRRVTYNYKDLPLWATAAP
ncbi:MAG: reverse transcriptase-like protein [Armatimonadota bacterium]|nr:reverse transcriptase-like protein [Armatimonadota bacterium]